jgi:UDP-glucuronate 4-epimerase
MRRILVTGAAGFIGSHLVERLIAEGGFSVTGLDCFDDFYDPALKRRNIAPSLASERFRLIEGDIRDERLVETLFAEGRFDQVVHIAARAGVRPSIERPLLYEDVNVRGTLVILEAMRRHGPREIIFASTSSIYGESTEVPFRESQRVDRPISPYAATKRSCELHLATYERLFGIACTALRFFTVYGPRQRPDLAIAKFTRLIDRGEPIPVYGDGSFRRDFTYIDDILDGVRAAMDRCRGYEIYNLGESATTSVNELVALLEDALGKKATIDRRPPQLGDVPLTYADVSLARERLGYRPRTPIADGIRRYVAWYRAERRGGSSAAEMQ